MTGPQFARILESLSENQLRDLKSIVYAGQNEFDKSSMENLRVYLKKRAPYSLIDLKLLGVKCME